MNNFSVNNVNIIVVYKYKTPKLKIQRYSRNPQTDNHWIEIPVHKHWIKHFNNIFKTLKQFKTLFNNNSCDSQAAM